MSLAQYTGTIFDTSGRIFQVTACTENSSPLKQKHINSRNTCVSHCRNSACCSASEFPLHRSLAGCRNFKTGAGEKFHPSKIKYNPNTTFVTEYVFFYRDYWNLNTNLWWNPELLWEKINTILYRSADIWKACKPPDSTTTDLGRGCASELQLNTKHDSLSRFYKENARINWWKTKIPKNLKLPQLMGDDHRFPEDSLKY